MAKFKNVSPLGALEVPMLGRVVAAGEVFEVAADDVAYFEGQTGNFTLVKTSKPAAGKGKQTDQPEGAPPAENTSDVEDVENEEDER